MTALNFDPYAALAEIQDVGGLTANGAKGANLAPTLAPLAVLALSPAQDATWRGVEKSCGNLASWQAALARLDATTSPEGFAPDRWRELVDDARWLAGRHAGIAAALGWNVSDLFGLDDTLDGWGGLADRLRGARRATFTDTVARWRSGTEDGWLWRHTKRPMLPLWERQEKARRRRASPVP